MRYLGKEENKELSFVYAVTSFGTRGRAWRYERGADYLTPLFGSDDLAERRGNALIREPLRGDRPLERLRTLCIINQQHQCQRIPKMPSNKERLCHHVS
jgi:hypothetical protein